MIIPLLAALYFSLTNWNGVRPLISENPYQFIGLQNYQNLLISGRRVAGFLHRSEKHCLLRARCRAHTDDYCVAAGGNPEPEMVKEKRFFRTAFYFPSITSSVVISLIFVFLFTKGGPVNGLLQGLIPQFYAYHVVK